MNEEEKEIIERIQQDSTFRERNLLRMIEKQQAEIEKKDKMIDLMAMQLVGLTIFDIEKEEPSILGNKEEVKEYFERKIEEREK